MMCGGSGVFVTVVPSSAVLAAAIVASAALAQGPMVRYGDPVPRDVREMYDAGLRYLIKTQDESGAWKDGQAGPGVTGMAVMALLASGEDPNHGPYRVPIRKALRSMIVSQNAETGFLGSGQGHDSMYQHGFGMLALSEAYGTVDDRGLWTEASAGGRQGRPLGQALELAVRCAVTSGRSNPHGAWRYSPDAKDADTSVSGAVLMGLLGARNAGIEVPDETIDKAIRYYASMTGPNGQLGYSGGPGGGSDAVTSIGVLVYAIARQKGLPQYATSSAYLKGRSLGGEQGAMEGYPTYTRYYRAQALFQADVAVWEKWNAGLVKEMKSMQAKDGSFAGFAGRGGGFGGTVDTSLALLSLAVNYKFLPVYER
ncbi:MAG: squalene--hopene cyclase [Planctomycetaceae bacterium]